MSLPWARAGSRFTHLFEVLAIDILRATDVKKAAALLRISWDESLAPDGPVQAHDRGGQADRPSPSKRADLLHASYLQCRCRGRYGAADLARLKFIKSAQGVGFSLDEIAELLRLDDGAHCAEARRIAEHKLAILRQKLADLAAMERTLFALVGACGKRTGRVRCPIIEALRRPEPYCP